MRGKACWIFEEPSVQVNRRNKRFLAVEDFEFELETSVSGSVWDYDVVSLRPRSDRDGCGVRVDEQVEVYKPEDACRNEFAFVIKTKTYRNLAPHLKAPINLAWRKAKEGRDVLRVFWNDDVIFYFPLRFEKLGNVEDVTRALDEALQSVGAGCIISDPYELKRLREMSLKFGQTVKDD
jgi:hypothetical protein